MQSIIINIAKDFSSTPGPRFISEGEWSGELFRTQYLLPKVKKAISENIELKVILDGTAGYGTSFLEESFGGLIRIEMVDYDKLIKILKIISDEEPYLIDDIKEYLKDAQKKEQNNKNNI